MICMQCYYRYCPSALTHGQSEEAQTYQAGGKDDISPNQRLCLFHLFEQFRVSDDTGSVPDLATRLV